MSDQVTVTCQWCRRRREPNAAGALLCPHCDTVAAPVAPAPLVVRPLTVAEVAAVNAAVAQTRCQSRHEYEGHSYQCQRTGLPHQDHEHRTGTNVVLRWQV